MADLEHSALVDPNIHEPKNISSATSGQVYIANGAAGGSWDTIPSTIASNEVVVNSLSDLPTPTASVITLADNTFYRIGGSINLLDNRLKFGINSVIEGNSRLLSSLTSSTTGDFITATGVDCRVSKITIFAGNCSKVISFDGSDIRTLRVDDCLVFNYPAIGISCNNATAMILVFSLFIGGTTGAICLGPTNTNLLVEASAFVGFTSKGLDLGSSIWQDASMTRSFFSGGVGSYSISGLASSGNITSDRRFSIFNTTFNGDGTPLENIAVNDIRYLFTDNLNVTNTTIDGQMYLAGSALTTTLVASTPTLVNAATWVDSHSDRFTVGTGGRLTYVGEESIQVFASLSLTGAGVSGSVEFNLYLAKNGTELVESKVIATCPSTAITSLATFAIVDMDKNDYLEAFLESAGTNFNTTDGNMAVKV